MKRKRFFAALLSLSLALLCLIPAAGAVPADDALIDGISALLKAGPYQEGSVIAGFRNMTEEDLSVAFGSSRDFRAEALLGVSAESLGLAGAEGTILLAEIRSDRLTAEKLLYLLAEDPRVAFAEPNYLVEQAYDLDGEIGSEEKHQPVTPYDQIPLLTQFQWGLSDQSNMRDIPLDGQEPHASVNAAHSLSGLDGSAPNMAGAPVYVALIDDFVDWQNEDLKPIMCHFTEEEQAALGCGEWGYDATNYHGGGQAPDNFLAGDHGTHCAGLIGARWDGHGVSGAASNVKILSIQSSDPVPYDHSDPFADAPAVIASMMRAYAFIDKYNSYYEKADPGRIIRVISMSLGCNMSNRTINAAVYELGRRYGTVTFVAAGNETRNNDTFLDSHGTLRQNPYAIVVAAHNQSGNLSDFSNYGPETVTLSAPGTNMLSTFPLSEAAYFPGLIRDGDYRDIFCEQFDDGYSEDRLKIVQYSGDRTSEAYTLTVGNGPRWSGQHALAMKIDKSLLDTEEHDESIRVASFRVTISLTKEEVAKILNPASPGGEPLPVQFGFIFYGTEAKMENDPVQIHLEGEETTVFPRLERKDLHETSTWSVIGTGPSEDTWANFTGIFPENYGEPKAEKLIVELSFQTTEEAADTFYFDTFAIGVCGVPYTIYEGTSMATPTAAGIGAVLASRHPEEDGMQLAARIRASVAPNDDMRLKLQAGGRLDLGRDQGGAWAAPGAVAPTRELWESTHPLPADTGLPFIPDGIEDYETAGCFAELNGRLWYMPSMLCETANRRNANCSDRIWCFNPAADAWEAENTATVEGGALAGASMCVWNGELWICGMETKAVPNDYSILDDTGEMKLRILSYNPETRAWREHSTAGVTRAAAMTLFADENGLKLFDNRTSGDPEEGDEPNNALIYEYDPSAGVGRQAAELPAPIVDAQIVTHGAVTYVLEMSETSSECRLFRVEGGNAVQLNVTFPDFLAEKNPSYSARTVRSLIPSLQIQYLSLVAGNEALYLVGYKDRDKQADTWFLPYGSDTLQPYGKQLTAMRPSAACAVFHDGKLYGIAADWGENESRAFRSTRVEGQ